MTFELKRFDLVGEYDPYIDEQSNGDYVRYEDALAAIAAEREACAKIADEQADTVNSRWIAEEIATSIRARGETK